MTNMKSHMGFRLAPRSMTLDALELHKFEFSVNFSGFRGFRKQQQLNAWRYASIVSDNVVSTSNWSNFGRLSHRAGLSATAGLYCLQQNTLIIASGPLERVAGRLSIILLLAAR